MNRYQRRIFREKSKQAAAEYIPAADCIGKEFVFSASIFRVIEHHPRKGKFTCEKVNAFDARVELGETFVRHHCTPPTPADPHEYPKRPAPAPRYFPQSASIISDKTELGATAGYPVGDNMTQPEFAVETRADVHLETTSTESTPVGTAYMPSVAAADILAPTVSFNTNLVTGDIKNQGEWHRCLVIARELKVRGLWGGILPLHVCGDVTVIHHHMTFHRQLPHMKLVGNQWHCYLDTAAILVAPIAAETHTPVMVSMAKPAPLAIEATPVVHSVTTVTVSMSKPAPRAIESAPVIEAAPVAVVAAPAIKAKPRDPAYYLDQKFVWTTEDGTSRTVTVQAFSESRNKFRLYEPTCGCWFREPEFVYERCTPAAVPVVREPLPTIKFNPRHNWNLVSMSDKREIIAGDVQATGVPQADPLRTCGCCGQHLTIIGKQVYPAKYNIKDQILVECRNEACVAHRRTATSDSHHEICEAAKCEALKKEQHSYAVERAQHWLAEHNQLVAAGKEQTKPAQVAQRKAQYWLAELHKLEGKS
jgi:hypothetical protein